jgi:hypothetical protein
MRRKIAFLPTALDDFNWWATEDRKIHVREEGAFGAFCLF